MKSRCSTNMFKSHCWYGDYILRRDERYLLFSVQFEDPKLV